MFDFALSNYVQKLGRVTPCAPYRIESANGAHGVTRPTAITYGGRISLSAPHQLKTAHKSVEPLQPLFDIRHAGRITDAQIVIRAKGNPGDRGNLFSFEQFRAEF